MKYLVYIALAVFILVGADSVYHRVNVSSFSKQEQLNKAQVLKTFAWFNQHSTSGSKLVLSKKMIADYFNDDAVMVTNGKLACKGIDEHFTHFVEFQDKLKSMKTGEFFNVSAKGDNVYLHYTLNVEKLNGDKDLIHVAGYMTLKNDKISAFHEVIHHDKQEDLDFLEMIENT